MLNNVLPRLTESAYSILRLVAGLMFASHGAQKLLGWYAQGPAPEVLSQRWFGGIIELVGGALIAIGLFARGAAFIASGTMAVAYIQFHWKGQFGDGFFPIVNGGELALLYALVFLFVACRGAGGLSVDSLRGSSGRR